MIGNDIIDLQLAKQQTNWQRKGWLQKVFHDAEIKYLQKDEDPNRMVWVLWSMKEAAYKSYQRLHPHPPRFNPKDYHCKLVKSFSSHNNGNYQFTGIVLRNGIVMPTQTKCTEAYIYTETKVGEDQFNFESKIIQHCKCLLLHRFGAAKVCKDQYGIPSLVYTNGNDALPISITHHGKFYAYLVTN